MLSSIFNRSPKKQQDVLAQANGGEELVLSTDTGRITRLGFAVLGLGFGGFILWAAFAPLDEGVPTQGTVSIATKSKAVQHLQSGIVREVLVHEGQQVETGQVLIRLDSADARANYETTRQQYFGLRAMEGRLMAEQLGQSTINFDPELIAAAQQDPIIQQHILVQNQLLRSRRDALSASIAANQAQIVGLEAQVESYAGMYRNRESQANLLKQQLVGIRDLVKDGYAPLNQQLELERQVAEIAAYMSEAKGNESRSRQQISQLQQTILSLRNEYRKEVDTQLQDVRREVEGIGGRYRAAVEDLKRTEIRSPATGQVVGLAIQTVGGVIQSGQLLMNIVPENEALMLDTKIAPHLIDRVRSGDPVDVRFTAFAHSPTMVIDGVISSISADVLADPESKTSYYLARVMITPDGMKKLGHRQLQPGMPVEVVVKTGERTLLTYLLHPLMKRVAASMKEE